LKECRHSNKSFLIIKRNLSKYKVNVHLITGELLLREDLLAETITEDTLTIDAANNETIKRRIAYYQLIKRRRRKKRRNIFIQLWIVLLDPGYNQ
jgi:hypothetical protein